MRRGDLTDKQRTFAQEYLKDKDGTKAAVRSGYTARSAHVIASRLLRKVKVKAYLVELLEAQAKRNELTADRIINALLNVAEFDPRDLLTDAGEVKDVRDWPDRAAKAVTGIEIAELFEGKDDSKTQVGVVKKIKTEGRVGALIALGRHLKMFTDLVEFPGLPTMTPDEVMSRLRMDQSKAKTEKVKRV